MKKDRGVLEDVLNKLFEEYNRDSEVIFNVKKELAEYDINVGIATGILNTTIPIQTQSASVLCLVTLALYHATNKSIIKPEDYFFDEEIETAKKPKKQPELKKNYVEINDIKQVAEDQWITTMTYKQVAELYSVGRVKYNKDTQRNTIFREYGDKIIEAININKGSVKEIKELMLKGLFIPNTITFNILATGKEHFEIDNRNKSMRVYDSLDIIDGFHRSLSLIEAISENPELEQTIEVRITNFNVDKCHRFIVQEDKKNKIDKKYIQTINVEEFENKVVKQLNERSDSELMGKITTSIIFYRNQGYVLGNVLADAIKHNFEIKSMRDVNNVSDFLIEGFVEIIGKFINDFKNLEESRKINVKTYSSTFIGYITLLSELKETKNWESKLDEILNQIDFNLNNPIWNTLDIRNSSPSKSTFKKIHKYFKELVEKGVN
jgi:hypothetical protein